MHITIGFISSTLIEAHFRKIAHELSHFCDIIYLKGSNHQEIIKSYQEYEHQVDAFLFSGRAVYYYLLNQIKTPHKPCYYFDESNVDIRGIFWDLLIQDRQYDFSRIYVDTALAENNYLGIKDMLPEDQYPYFTDFDYHTESTLISEEKVLEHHLKLHRSGQIDLSITRLGNYIDFFESHQIPYLYAYPSTDYMINFTMKIIQRVSQSLKEDTIIASILVAPKAMVPSKGIADAAHIRRALQEYGQVKGYDLTLQETGTYVEALTFYRDIEKMTEGFTSSQILSLEEYLDGTELVIGFGTGRSAYQARTNAKEALNLSTQKGDGLYCLTYEDKLIGPFSKSLETYDLHPSDEIIQYAKTFHIDPLNVQKIIAYCQITHSKVVTSDGLAEYLKISLRSANRLLTKILDNRGATSFLQNVDNKPGRPKKFYDLHFVTLQDQSHA